MKSKKSDVALYQIEKIGIVATFAKKSKKYLLKSNKSIFYNYCKQSINAISKEKYLLFKNECKREIIAKI